MVSAAKAPAPIAVAPIMDRARAVAFRVLFIGSSSCWLSCPLKTAVPRARLPVSFFGTRPFGTLEMCDGEPSALRSTVAASEAAEAGLHEAFDGGDGFGLVVVCGVEVRRPAHRAGAVAIVIDAEL